MADPSPEVRPELDRRSFLKGSSVAAVGTVFAAAGLAAGSAEATAAVPAPPAAGKTAGEGGNDLKARWLAG